MDLKSGAVLGQVSDPAKFGPWIRRIVFGVTVFWVTAFGVTNDWLPKLSAYRIGIARRLGLSASHSEP